jgi:hypothetical protein
MHQVKIFKSIESELWALEAEINNWLKESKAKVISVTGNIAPQSDGGTPRQGTFTASDVLIVVVYETE